MISTQIKKILTKHYLFDFPISIDDKEQIDKLKEFIYDRRNSSLGDSLINFIYSCSKTLNNHSLSSNKVSDIILVNSYHNSKIKHYLKISGEKKKLGNYLESLLLLAWSYELLNIEEMVEKLKEEMSNDMFNTPVEEKRVAIKAFTRLFNIISNLIFMI